MVTPKVMGISITSTVFYPFDLFDGGATKLNRKVFEPYLSFVYGSRLMCVFVVCGALM
jgi:hypothetical protein